MVTSKRSSLSSSCSGSNKSLDFFEWREKRQRLFIYWCFTHFIHGMIHSIRYSSQYLYFKDEMQVQNPDFLYGLSVSFMGTTGVIFPLFISPYIDNSRNIKKAILIINVLGLVGNLLYSLPFSPVIPLIGQLLAGTTPAFGVIAMGEISRCYSPEKLTKRVSALSLIYSVGTFTSIGLVFCFLYIDFYIGKWHINYASMPGLFLTLAFTVSTVLSLILVSDVSKEFDLKLEERIKRSSCESTPRCNSTPETISARSSPALSRKSSENSSARNSPLPTRKLTPTLFHKQKFNDSNNDLSHKIWRQKGQPLYFALNDRGQNKTIFEEQHFHINIDNTETNTSKSFTFPPLKKHLYAKLPQEDYLDDKENTENTTSPLCATSPSCTTSPSCATAGSTVHFIWKIISYRNTALLMAVTFMEAFIYSIIVTSLPVLASQYLQWGKVELAVLSMVNKFLSVIISGSIYFLTDYLHDFLLLIYGTFLSALALLTLSVISLVKGDSTAMIAMLFTVAALSISGVPLVITSTRAMLAKLVPTEIQSLTEAVRMSVFEASFVPAGFLVPLVTLNVTATAATLLVSMLVLSSVVIRYMKDLVELKEEDDYWKMEENSRPSSGCNN